MPRRCTSRYQGFSMLVNEVGSMQLSKSWAGGGAAGD